LLVATGFVLARGFGERAGLVERSLPDDLVREFATAELLVFFAAAKCLDLAVLLPVFLVLDDRVDFDFVVRIYGNLAPISLGLGVQAEFTVVYETNPLGIGFKGGSLCKR
jgi:hypothetical protein